MFQSESDYPVEPFSLNLTGKKDISVDDIIQSKGYSTDTPVETVKFENFFKNATKEQSWHGQEEKETVRKFQELVRILKDNLSSIKIYKIGKVELDVYVVGKTKYGTFSGIKTKVVET
jgi:hypothetical protein